MTIQSDGPAPYTAPKAIISLVEAYRTRGLTTPFTVDVLIKAGVSETLAPRTLNSLKLLGLIDEAGEPTPQFVDLRKAGQDDFQPRLQALLREAYAEVFSYVDPATDAHQRIRDAFRSYTPFGQQGRMVTLFLGLCEYAGLIEASAEPQGSRGRTPATAPRERTTAARELTTRIIQPNPRRIREARAYGGGYEAPSPGGHQLIQGLLRELPPVGGTWQASKRDAWLELQRAVFNVLYTIEDGDPVSAPGQGGESG